MFRLFTLLPFLGLSSALLPIKRDETVNGSQLIRLRSPILQGCLSRNETNVEDPGRVSPPILEDCTISKSVEMTLDGSIGKISIKEENQDDLVLTAENWLNGMVVSFLEKPAEGNSAQNWSFDGQRIHYEGTLEGLTVPVTTSSDTEFCLGMYDNTLVDRQWWIRLDPCVNIPDGQDLESDVYQVWEVLHTV